MANISEFMSEDHDKLDAIFADFRNEPDSAKARDLLERFDAGLRAHIVWEEDILFPPLEEKSGMKNSGPTAVMRAEHQQIKALLQTIAEQIGSPAVGESSKELLGLLTAHNQKEELILYPMLDRSLADEEKARLLERIQER